MTKIKLIIIMVLLATTACYNAAMMRASGEARDTCQSDSDCPADYMCVKNVSADSTLGECVSQDDYDPWANRQLEDIIKLKNKKKVKETPETQPETTIDNPDDTMTREEIRKALYNLIENAIVEAAHLQMIDAREQQRQQVNGTKEQCQCIQQNK